MEIKNPVSENRADLKDYFNQALFAVALVDTFGRIKQLNKTADRFLHGLRADGLPLAGLLLPDLFLSEEHENIRSWLKDIFQSELEQTITTRIRVNGHNIDLQMIGKRLQEDLETAQIVLLKTSVNGYGMTDLAMLAYYDPLTKLPNRHLLYDRLQQAISTAERSTSKIAVLMIDLDRFKRINDTWGHLAGDQALLSIGRNLLGTLRETDTLARWGGDEFMVISQFLAENQSAALIAERIIEVLRRPIELQEGTEQINGSVGISIYPDDAGKIDTLLQRADLALYRAKEEGGNTFCFFDNKMEEELQKRRHFEKELRDAMLCGQISMYYQPIFSSYSKKIIAFEALLRWNSPLLGVLAAAEFLPVAQETGLDKELTNWALKEACRQMAVWLEKGIIAQDAEYKMTLNLSRNQLLDPEIMTRIKQALKEAGLPPQYIVFEVKEKDYHDSDFVIQRTLKALREMNTMLFLDDFCAGFCKLTANSAFNYSSIKIDQTTTHQLIKSDQAPVFFCALTDMAHAAGKKIIVEGVESQDLYLKLSRYGFDALQGYWLCEPLSAIQMELLLQTLK